MSLCDRVSHVPSWGADWAQLWSTETNQWNPWLPGFNYLTSVALNCTIILSWLAFSLAPVPLSKCPYIHQRPVANEARARLSGSGLWSDHRGHPPALRDSEKYERWDVCEQEGWPKMSRIDFRGFYGEEAKKKAVSEERWSEDEDRKWLRDGK